MGRRRSFAEPPQDLEWGDFTIAEIQKRCPATLRDIARWYYVTERTVGNWSRSGVRLPRLPHAYEVWAPYVPKPDAQRILRCESCSWREWRRILRVAAEHREGREIPVVRRPDRSCYYSRLATQTAAGLIGRLPELSWRPDDLERRWRQLGDVATMLDWAKKGRPRGAMAREIRQALRDAFNWDDSTTRRALSRAPWDEARTQLVAQLREEASKALARLANLHERRKRRK